MSTNAKSVRLSLSATCHRYHELTLHDHLQDFSSDSPRRPYVRLALRVDCAAAPPHWDLTSGGKDLDISEEDGYVLSANGEASPSTLGVLVPCEPLTAVSRARPGRLRVKPWILHRRRVFDITTSPTSPTVSASSLLSLPPPPRLLTNHSSPQPITLPSALRLPHPRSPSSHPLDAQHRLQESLQQSSSARCSAESRVLRGATDLTHLTTHLTSGVLHALFSTPATTRAPRADELARGDERSAPDSSTALAQSQPVPVPALWPAAEAPGSPGLARRVLSPRCCGLIVESRRITVFSLGGRVIVGVVCFSDFPIVMCIRTVLQLYPLCRMYQCFISFWRYRQGCLGCYPFSSVVIEKKSLIRLNRCESMRGQYSI